MCSLRPGDRFSASLSDSHALSLVLTDERPGESERVCIYRKMPGRTSFRTGEIGSEEDEVQDTWTDPPYSFESLVSTKGKLARLIKFNACSCSHVFI